MILGVYMLQLPAIYCYKHVIIKQASDHSIHYVYDCNSSNSSPGCVRVQGSRLDHRLQRCNVKAIATYLMGCYNVTARCFVSQQGRGCLEI